MRGCYFQTDCNGQLPSIVCSPGGAKILTITLSLILACNKPQALDHPSGEKFPKAVQDVRLANNGVGGYFSSRGFHLLYNNLTPVGLVWLGAGLLWG